MRVHELTSLDRAELDPYRTMKWQWEQRQSGVFVAEGEKVVRRLLHSPLTVVSLLIPPRWLPPLEPLLRQRPEEIDVFVAPKEQLETMTGYTMYQGLLALARVPSQPSLNSALAQSPQPRLLVAMDGLTNAENLGVVARNSLAFGAQILIAGETSGSPYLRRAVRSSMGAVFKLQVIESDHLPSTLQELKQAGIRIVAAHPRCDEHTLSQSDLACDSCIVFGNEGSGISRAVLAQCDDAVAIPMAKDVDSLNVGSASAALLYEAARQRGWIHRFPFGATTRP